MLRRWRFRKRCRGLADGCREASLAAYLSGCAELRPTDVAGTPMIAVDLELTGLDAAKDHIISVG